MSAQVQLQRTVTEQVPNNEYYTDEINLKDIVLIIWRNRIAMAIAATSVMLLTVFHLLVAIPVYKVKTFFSLPLEQDIEELNFARRFGTLGYERGVDLNKSNSTQRFKVLGYQRERVFEEFLNQLRSKSLRRQFFDHQNLYDYYVKGNKGVTVEQVFDQSFSGKLQIDVPKKNKNPYTSLSFEMDNADKAALLLNEYIDFVARHTAVALVENVNSDIRATIQELSTKIDTKRITAKQQREDIMVELQENLIIANKLGITDPINYGKASASAGSSEQQPLYTRGSIALQAEIDVYSKRKNDDAFIEGLRDLQESLAQLQTININPEKVRVLRIDQLAFAPYQAEKPKKLLILVIGFFIALIIGLFAAFIWEFIRVLRKQLQISVVP